MWRRATVVGAAFLFGACGANGGGFLGMFDPPADTDPVPPSSQGDAYAVDENATLHANASQGVLANDASELPASLIATVTSLPAHGSLAMAPDGSFEYTPEAEYFGTDSFVYFATDDAGSSEPAIVQIRVDRGFTLTVDLASLELVQGSSATLSVTVQAIDSVVPAPVVSITLDPTPAGVVTAPLEIAAGTSAPYLIVTSGSTPQVAWTTLTVRGTLGEKSLDVPLAFRIRGPSGALDTTLAGGVLHFLLDGDSSCRDIAVQPDGKIVAAGLARKSPDGYYFPTAVRFLDDGTLDTTFGNGGSLRIEMGAFGAFERLFLEPDGKLLLGAWAARLFGQFHDGWAAVRLSPDGDPDPSYAVNGISKINPGGFGSLGLAGVERLADGGLIFSGSLGNSEPVGSVIGRVTPNGGLDPSYGQSGIRWYWYDPNDNTFPRALALDTAGRASAIGVARERVTSFHRIGIARFTAGGSLDGAFSGDGVMRVDLGPTEAMGESLHLLPDGRMLISALRINETPSGETYTTILQMLEADGSAVATFGSSGTLTLETPGNFDVTIDEQGRLLATGTVNDGSFQSVFLARFGLDGTPDAAFNGSGHVYSDPGYHVNLGDRRAVDPEGRILLCGTSQPLAAGESLMTILRVWP